MKFKVTMKDPDTLYDAIRHAVCKELQDSGIADQEEVDALEGIRIEKAMQKTSKWFQYGEYLTVEIDTDADTIKVVETK